MLIKLRCLCIILHYILSLFNNLVKLWKQKKLCAYQYQPRVSTLFYYIFLNIYIFVLIAVVEISVLVACQFSMQTIYKSYDLGRDVWRSDIGVSQ